jgi:hypothetical protein
VKTGASLIVLRDDVDDEEGKGDEVGSSGRLRLSSPRGSRLGMMAIDIRDWESRQDGSKKNDGDKEGIQSSLVYNICNRVFQSTWHIITSR